MQTQSNCTSVIIPPTHWQLYEDSNGEPQPVTEKLPNSAWVYLSTNDVPSGEPLNDFRISNNITFIREASRLQFVGCGVDNWFIPNVNERNNRFRFKDFSPVQTIETEVPEGYYTTSFQLVTALTKAMNDVTSAGRYTAAAIPGRPDAYTISAGGQWFFYDSSLMITKGNSAFGIQPDQVLSPTHEVGPMPLIYTRFVDVCSTTLTKNAKMRSITSNSRSTIFVRAFMGGTDYGNTFYVNNLSPQLSFAFRPREQVTAIDIQLYDQNGDLLYIPDFLADSFRFNLTIHAEM